MLKDPIPDLPLIWERLHQGNPLSIIFQKRDGTIRQLTVTRNPKLLPANETQVLDETPYFDKADVMFRFWDIDAGQWKRIYKASIIEATEDGKALIKQPD